MIFLKHTLHSMHTNLIPTKEEITNLDLPTPTAILSFDHATLFISISSVPMCEKIITKDTDISVALEDYDFDEVSKKSLVDLLNKVASSTNLAPLLKRKKSDPLPKKSYSTINK